MAKKAVKEEKINLDTILFKCRDILRAARNSGSFFEKRDMMLTLVFLRFIGEKFEGIISGVTNWGIYVELPNTIEGMVHVSILPGDYYYYDEKTYSMVGERTGRTFKLGEKAKIRVKDVDMMLKNIDFEFVVDDDYELSEDGWN